MKNEEKKRKLRIFYQFYFYELFLGQFLSLCFVIFESGTPILVTSLLFPIIGILLVEEAFDYFPTFIDKEWEGDDKNNDKEKLFFHDVINKTHAIKLYLRSQKDGKKGIDIEGIDNLLSEVESLQLLFKDHFRESHKNLKLLDDYVGMEKAIQGAKRLLFYFIPEGKNINILDKENMFKSDFSKDREEYRLVHYASFYRIFGNLIKNISDHGGYNVSVVFEDEDNFFHIIVKNNFHKSEDSSDERIEKSFGLKSIERNCLEQNGQFKFIKKGTMWKSEIWLPFQKTKKTILEEKKEGA